VNKKRVYLFFAIMISLFFLFEAKKTFSQDRRDIQTFKPNSQSQSNKSGLIKQWAEQLKKSRGIKELYFYKDVVLNLSSVCEVSANRKECLEKTKEILGGYNWAMGRCKNLEEVHRNACMAIRKNDCSSLTYEGDRKKCQGYLDLDPQLIKESFAMEGEMVDMKSITIMLAYYSVFKSRNILACRQLLKDDAYYRKVGCKILLNPDPQDIIDNYVLDFTYYYYADNKHEKSACNDIKDNYIKTKCQKGMPFSSFIDTYFLEN